MPRPTLPNKVTRTYPPRSGVEERASLDRIYDEVDKVYEIIHAQGVTIQPLLRPSPAQALLSTVTHQTLVGGSSRALSESQGSIVPAVCSAMTYDCSLDTEIAWTWIGFEIRVPSDWVREGKITVVDGGIDVTGLSNDTYYFYPYWDIGRRVIAWASSADAIGTPAIAYTSRNLVARQIQIGDGHIPLSESGIEVLVAKGTSGMGGGVGG